jgi:hypothetical protein
VKEGRATAQAAPIPSNWAKCRREIEFVFMLLPLD